jgi:type III restriction enzyme
MAHAQIRYETYFTTSGSTIDTPHDFSEVNISTIYTGSRKSKYRDRVEAVVKKRLKLVNIDASAIEFFPEDEDQEKEICRLGEKYKTDHQGGKGRGYRPSDDAVRYARPDYIRSLAGPHKQSHSYSYAGFEQLVHLSSGVIRYFIEPAHKMFSETLAKYPPKPPNIAITHIPPGIQSDVVRDEAVRFLFDDLEKLEQDKSNVAPPKELLRKLDNLIQGLGGMFRQCLISDRSERRVFSIAFADVSLLALDRFRLRDEIENRIQEHRNGERKSAFKDFLLDGSALTVSAERVINFKTMSYEPSWLYEGGFQFKKHYFGQKPGELLEKTPAGKLKEEFECAQFLDGLPEVKFWVRNLARKSTSFRLQTSTDWFYPDFICQLNDGRALVVEYKGEHLYAEAEEKRAVGAVWESRSAGKCLFVMPEGKDLEKIRQKIARPA